MRSVILRSRHAARTRGARPLPAGVAPGVSAGAGRVISVVRPLFNLLLVRWQTLAISILLLSGRSQAEQLSRQTKTDQVLPVFSLQLSSPMIASASAGLDLAFPGRPFTSTFEGAFGQGLRLEGEVGIAGARISSGYAVRIPM